MPRRVTTPADDTPPADEATDVEQAPEQPTELPPDAIEAAAQEQAEADAAQLAHLRGRVPALRLAVNRLQRRVNELEVENERLKHRQPADRQPPAKRPAAKKAAAKKAPSKGK